MSFVDSGALPSLFFSFIQITVGIDRAADELWNLHRNAVSRQPLFEFVMFAYYLIMLIMVNLLIAILSSTYANQSKTDATRAMLIIEKHNKMRGMVRIFYSFPSLSPSNRIHNNN